MESSRRRHFNSDEKRELYLKAGGRCSICRVRLEEDWHADHIEPFSAEGETTLENGQALCSKCNLRKSARSFSLTVGDGGPMSEAGENREPSIDHWSPQGKSEYAGDPYPIETHATGSIGEGDNALHFVSTYPRGYREKSLYKRLAFGGELSVWDRIPASPSERRRPPEFAVRIVFAPRLQRTVFCETVSELIALLGELKPLEVEER